MFAQRPRDLLCQAWFETTLFIDRGQFAQLGVRVRGKLAPLKREIRDLRVSLRADGHKLAGRHRHGAGAKRGNTRGRNRACARARSRDAQHDASSGKNPVVGSKHRSAKPVRAVAQVPLGMASSTHHNPRKSLSHPGACHSLGCMSDEATGDLEFDLKALSGRLRDDHSFADEVYCALCNTDWTHLDGTTWHRSWRYSAWLIADLRDLGEDSFDFYCTRACEEGTISDRVAAAMAELGWTGQGHGSRVIYALEPTGEQTVWVNGDWVDVDEARRDHPELFTGKPADDPESF